MAPVAARQVSDFGLSRVVPTETAVKTNTCGTVRARKVYGARSHVGIYSAVPDVCEWAVNS